MLLRLFYFLKNFIESPFVLIDLQQEIQFRISLANLFEDLVPPSASILLQTTQLKKLAQVNKSNLIHFYFQIFISVAHRIPKKREKEHPLISYVI